MTINLQEQANIWNVF